MSKNKLYHKEYYQKNKIKISEKGKQYYSTHKNETRERRKKYRQKIRRQIFDLLGGECCNPYKLNHGDFLKDERCFHIDHINGGGNLEENQNLNGFYYLKILKKILSGSKDYQLLCANCNFIKLRENEENTKAYLKRVNKLKE